MTKLQIGSVYQIGDDRARILWMGESLAVLRIWASDLDEKEDGFEDSQDLAYCEEHLRPAPG